MLQTALSVADDVQRNMGPRWAIVEPLRLHTLPRLDPYARKRWDRPLVREKGPEDYVCTVYLTTKQLSRVVWPTYHRNLLSTKKYRTGLNGEVDWEVANWRHVPTDDPRHQHHLYYFREPDGGLDLYHHKEVNFVVDPKGHENEPQFHGDPDGILRDTLGGSGVTWKRRSME